MFKVSDSAQFLYFTLMFTHVTKQDQDLTNESPPPMFWTPNLNYPIFYGVPPDGRLRTYYDKNP